MTDQPAPAPDRREGLREAIDAVANALNDFDRSGESDAWPTLHRDWEVVRLAALAAASTPQAVDGLDAAWAEAEAALPKGWSFWEVTGYSPDEDQPEVRVFARVRTANTIDRKGNVPEVFASASTPAAALRALAARLTEKQP
jgi:hypothetical protein